MLPPFCPTQEFDKLSDFFKAHYCLELAEKDLCVKGWNWGTVRFGGEFQWQPKGVGWDVPTSVWLFCCHIHSLRSSCFLGMSSGTVRTFAISGEQESPESQRAVLGVESAHVCHSPGSQGSWWMYLQLRDRDRWGQTVPFCVFLIGANFQGCSRKGESLELLEGGNAVMRTEALLDFGRGARPWLEMGFVGHSSELAVMSLSPQGSCCPSTSGSSRCSRSRSATCPSAPQARTR